MILTYETYGWIAFVFFALSIGQLDCGRADHRQ